MPLVAVTTETLLGVATPVMVGVVEPLLEPPELEVEEVPLGFPERVEAVSLSPEPPHPAIKQATAAAQAKPRNGLRNSIQLIDNTLMKRLERLGLE